MQVYHQIKDFFFSRPAQCKFRYVWKSAIYRYTTVIGFWIKDQFLNKSYLLVTKSGSLSQDQISIKAPAGNFFFRSVDQITLNLFRFSQYPTCLFSQQILDWNTKFFDCSLEVF